MRIFIFIVLLWALLLCSIYDAEATILSSVKKPVKAAGKAVKKSVRKLANKVTGLFDHKSKKDEVKIEVDVDPWLNMAMDWALNPRKNNTASHIREAIDFYDSCRGLKTLLANATQNKHPVYSKTKTYLDKLIDVLAASFDKGATEETRKTIRELVKNGTTAKRSLLDREASYEIKSMFEEWFDYGAAGVLGRDAWDKKRRNKYIGRARPLVERMEKYGIKKYWNTELPKRLIRWFGGEDTHPEFDPEVAHLYGEMVILVYTRRIDHDQVAPKVIKWMSKDLGVPSDALEGSIYFDMKKGVLVRNWKHLSGAEA